MKKKKEIILCILFSLFLGLITNDFLIGTSTLATGLLSAYYATKGNKKTYIYGCINYLLLGYIALKNELFGIFFFYLFLFAPLQIKGFFYWKKISDNNTYINMKTFNLKNSILIIISCLLGSTLLGILLNLLPTQQIAFLDATSNCINLCGMILLIIGFQEAWWLWLINNIIDFFIAIHCVINLGEHSIMMLITAIGFLAINIWEIIKWYQKKQEINRKSP